MQHLDNSTSSYYGCHLDISGHFTQLGTFLSKKDYSTEGQDYKGRKVSLGLHVSFTIDLLMEKTHSQLHSTLFLCVYSYMGF